MQNKLYFPEILCTLSAVLLLALPYVPFQKSQNSIPDSKSAAQISSDGQGIPEIPTLKKTLPNAETVSRSFWISSLSENSIPVHSIKAIEPVIIEPASADSWLKFLGIVSDEQNRERIYFKDSKTGNVLKVRLDGIVEDGIALVESSPLIYVIKINGTVYKISGGQK